jgi:hypothetical protein
MVPGQAEESTSSIAYWLISCNRPRGAKFLTLGGVLPVFGSEEEGLEFLLWYGERAHLNPKPVTVNGLLRLLGGSLVTVKLVALDLSPEIMYEKALDLVSLPRQSFVDALLGM